MLILVALFPSLTFGAMFGLGVIKTPWSTTAVLPERNDSVRLAVQASSVAIMPVPERVQSKQIAEDRALTLTTPATLEARAGEDIPFSIALDHTDELPARAIVAVSGLPQGTTLSSGRPYGEMEWNLRSDEIGDLRLALPNTASGETNLRIKLVTPGGEIIAGSETVLKVTAALGVTGLEERLANQDTETATTGGSVPSQPNTNVQTDDAHAKWIKPSAFVNLREGPSSSAAVISVVAKDTKLSVLGRKRGWVQVTNPETSESGWIYAENLATVTKSQRGTKQAADLDSPPASNYLWPSLSQWLTSP